MVIRPSQCSFSAISAARCIAVIGGVTVPEDVSITGWYDGSKPLDARQRATVIVGHRDARTQGPGALYGIELIHKNDLPLRRRRFSAEMVPID